MSLGIKNYRGLIRIVDLLHFKLIFFEDINMSKPILVPESDLMVIIQKFPYQINTFLSFPLCFLEFLSTWTFGRLPTYVDNRRHLVNHHLPHFVHVVIECPLDCGKNIRCFFFYKTTNTLGFFLLFMT